MVRLCNFDVVFREVIEALRGQATAISVRSERRTHATATKKIGY
ncbi:hypothetical protein GL4_2061 [Methyloceanibacter caenitepidi]|uniref:Uncharacterized protein n=1 Tax=Methyloceanibacter caenitepidi TaxID=1384459 RepID=A0A0A8K403_9HYPH|nr:hypothetical protein GL4_2061 [Methyloceanibacter caenitepidi]